MKLLIKNNDEVLRAKDFSTGKIEIHSYYSSNVKFGKKAHQNCYRGTVYLTYSFSNSPVSLSIRRMVSSNVDASMH